MEITQDQFTAKMQQMSQEAQAQVVQIIENNEPSALQAFAMSLGVTLSTGENQGPMDSPDDLEEAGGMGRLSPRERNIQEMQEFENRTDPDPDPDPDLSDPMTNVGQATATEDQPPVKVPSLPVASPMREQMQQLAMGDQVAGMIDQPGAEDQTGVADDVPMNVREGAFIINAAALAKVGRKDFEERIIEPAIEYLKEKDGIEIDKAAITKPAQQVNGDQKILASNKEYHIPPELAEVIGTDLLEKINNSGKAETEKKLEEQEQQPQQKQEVPVRAATGYPPGKKKLKNRDEEISRTLVAEAGVFKSKEALQKVLNVMFNRMADPNFRDDKGKKVTKLEDNLNPVQFNGFKSQKNKKLDEKQLKIARDLVKSAREGKLKDLTDGSTYFWNPQTSTSSWFRDNIANSDQYEQTTFDKVPKTKFEHIFYKLRPRLPNSPPEGRTPLALEEAPPAQEAQTDNIRVSPESVNRSFMAESPDQDPRLRTQTQPPAN
tara:strand:+ start:2769 stop:4241 length:1473 start_codon:yes stop_codon:yes gene_type:complete